MLLKHLIKMNTKKHSERGSKILKIADRYIGIPVVCLLGLFRKKSGRLPSHIKRIAILKTAGIGDTIILSAVIDDIKKTLPHSEITFICGQNNYEVCSLLGSIDKTVDLNIKNLFECIKTVKSLGQFDVWLDFGPWPRFNSVLSHFGKARYKAGFKTKKQHRHYIYDKAVEHIDHVADYHELFNYRNIVGAIGIDCHSLPHISVENSPDNTHKNRVAMHVFPGGSRAHLKEWPTKYWADLINWFGSNGFIIYLTGGPHDHEPLNKLRLLTKSPEKIVITAGSHSLLDTARLLSTSKLVISVDTGTVHLASALDCNLISIHGPTSPRRWGPLGKKAQVIETPCACAPCIDFGFDSNCKDNKCMTNITPEMVIEKCRMALTD